MWSGTSWSPTSSTPTRATTRPARLRPAAPRAGGRGEMPDGTGDGPDVTIEIANESGVDVDEAALARLARHVLDEMGVHPLAELSVLLVDEPAMAELHVRWMDEEGPTDVLAFPMDELRPPRPGGLEPD